MQAAPDTGAELRLLHEAEACVALPDLLLVREHRHVRVVDGPDLPCADRHVHDQRARLLALAHAVLARGYADRGRTVSAGRDLGEQEPLVGIEDEVLARLAAARDFEARAAVREIRQHELPLPGERQGERGPLDADAALDSPLEGTVMREAERL